MLIIFDLDDTLIDTTGSVSPFKMRFCLEKLTAAGFLVSGAPTSQETLLQCVEKRGVNAALAAMKEPLPEGFSVRVLPNAKEVLKELSGRHTLALVTSGYPPFQMEKLEKAGIDRACFSKIAVSEDFIKKPIYEALLKEFSVRPQEVLVCGDRVQGDLLPGFELGMRTALMRWGRGKLSAKEAWIDYEIFELSELKQIL